MSELRKASISQAFSSRQDILYPEHRPHLQRHLLNKLVHEIPQGVPGVIEVKFEELDTDARTWETDHRCVVEWREVPDADPSE